MKEKSIMDVVLETAENMHFDKVTMRELKALSVPKVKLLTPKEIKRIRIKEKASQNVMATCLNISYSTYQKWERGESVPTGTALVLLNVVRKCGLKSIILNG